MKEIERAGYPKYVCVCVCVCESVGLGGRRVREVGGNQQMQQRLLHDGF